MTAALILGGALGGALCLLAVALVPPRPSLAGQATRWQRARLTAPIAGRGTDATLEQWESRLGTWLVARLARRGYVFKQLRANLELTGCSLETHLARKVFYALGGLIAPSIVAIIWRYTGVHMPLPTSALIGFVLAGLGFWLPDSEVKRKAEDRREQLRYGLSCYLTWVSQSLAGGIGLPDAIKRSSELGTGWEFDLIRTTIERARLVGDAPWAALADLGRRTGTHELEDLGGSLQMAAGDGAKVRASLAARAASLRDRLLADTEAAAEKADQNMSLAQVVIVIGLLLFLGYPAMSVILNL